MTVLESIPREAGGVGPGVGDEMSLAPAPEASRTAVFTDPRRR